jgi:DcuC family C4-dicarboxylate transporter
LRLNPLKALVPLLPMALLFIVPTLIQLPQEFSNNTVSIAVAMSIAVAAAGLTAPKKSGRLMATFFEGVGFAYANIISIIIVATIFTEGIKANGLIEILTNALAHRPIAAKFASLILPFALAGVTGSGSAPAIAVMNVLVPVAAKMNLDAIGLGALIAVAAQLGRTMSPVAAVVVMCATLSGQPPLNLVKYVTIPLLAGLVALLVAALANWV